MGDTHIAAAIVIVVFLLPLTAVRLTAARHYSPFSIGYRVGTHYFLEVIDVSINVSIEVRKRAHTRTAIPESNYYSNSQVHSLSLTTELLSLRIMLLAYLRPSVSVRMPSSCSLTSLLIWVLPVCIKPEPQFWHHLFLFRSLKKRKKHCTCGVLVFGHFIRYKLKLNIDNTLKRAWWGRRNQVSTHTSNKLANLEAKNKGCEYCTSQKDENSTTMTPFI